MAHTDMIDKITEIIPGQCAMGTRGLTMTEDVFACHFPNFPVLPGVLMMKAINDLACELIGESNEICHKNPAIILKKMEKIKFHKFGRPGDNLKICVNVLKQDKNKVFVSGEIRCENTKIFQVKKIVYEISS